MPAPDELFAMHLADMRLRGLAEDTTIYARRCAIARLAAALDVPVEDATAAGLLAWRAALTVSPKSVGPYVDHVRGYYAWLVKSGHRSLPRPIKDDDLWRALGAASRRVRPWLVLAGWGTSRAAEIAYLRREDIDDTAANPSILLHGKGGKERVVPASTFVLAELRAHGLPARGLVFRRHDGLPGPNKPWLISKLANDCLHRSGTNATLHQLRHRCLSLLYQETLDLRLVQELAGHSSPATTAVYTLVSPARAAEAVEALPAPRRLRAVLP